MNRNVALIAALVVLAGGGAAAWALGRDTGSPPTPGDDRRADRQPTVSGRPAPPVDCSQPPPATVIGYTGQPSDITAGPLTFIGAGEGAQEPASAFRPRDGQDRGWKAPVAVQPGHAVTVRVEASAREIAALDYHTPTGDARRVADGEPAVTFRACPRGAPRSANDAVTTWNGVVVVKGPACVPLEIFTDQRTTPERLSMRIGLERCREAS